jgi:hypothetical protein
MHICPDAKADAAMQRFGGAFVQKEAELQRSPQVLADACDLQILKSFILKSFMRCSESALYLQPLGQYLK